MVNCCVLKISRLLKHNGQFISITFTQPHFRLPLYARPDYGWNIEVETFGSGFHYFFYVLTKGVILSSAHVELRNSYFRRRLEKSPVVFLSESDDEDFMIGSINLDSD